MSTSPPPGAPPRRRDPQKILVLIVLPAMLLTLFIAAGVWFAFADWDGGDNVGGDKAGDITSVDCSAGAASSATIEVAVTNRGSRARSYVISFEVTSRGGTRLGTGTVVVPSLAPGQSARETGVAFLTGADRYRDLTCQVTGLR